MHGGTAWTGSSTSTPMNSSIQAARPASHSRWVPALFALNALVLEGHPCAWRVAWHHTWACLPALGTVGAGCPSHQGGVLALNWRTERFQRIGLKHTPMCISCTLPCALHAHSHAHLMHTPMHVVAAQDLLASVPSKVDTLVFPNYEALPEADDVVSPFTQARCY